MRAGEGRVAALLTTNSFLAGLARVLILTASGAIFLDSQPPTEIPYVYIALGAAGVLVGLLIARAQARLSFQGFLTTLLGGTALVSLGLWVALATTDAPWAAFAAAVWGFVVELLVALQLGSLAEHVLDVRQLKRLYAMVGSGETSAEIVGGLATPLLVDLVGARGLVAVSAVALVGALALMRWVLATCPSAAAEMDDLDGSAEAAPRLPAILRGGYVRLILLVAALDALYFFVLDAAFWAEAQARFGDADEIATFFGTAFAAIAVVGLLVRAFGASRLIRRWGLLAGLIALPLVALPGVLAVVVLALVAPGAGALFWIFAATRLSYDVTYDALFNPTYQVLFEGLPPRERLATFSFLETLGKPLLAALTGVVLLLAMQVVPLDGVTASALGIVLLAGWIGSAFVVRGRYVETLRRTLQRRLVGLGSLALGDATSVGVLESGLTSPHAGAVLFALHRLESIDSWDAVPWMLRLLDHPVAEVRREALRRVEAARLATAEPAVRRLALADPDAAVRAAAVRALLACAPDGDHDETVGFLEHADQRVRRGALVGLAVHGGLGGLLAAAEALLRLRRSSDPTDRALVADALGDVAARPFYRPLEELLSDPDPTVRRAALRASGRIANPVLWPRVVAALDDGATRDVAAEALVAGDASALPAMMRAFDRPEESPDNRRRIVAAIGRGSAPEGPAELARRIEHSEVTVRHALLRVLVQRGYRTDVSVAEAAWRAIAAELSAAAWNLAALVDLRASAPAQLLREALELEVVRCRERVLWLLALVDPRAPVLDAVRNLGTGSAEQRTYATEVLDNVIASELKGAMLALLEPAEPAEQLSRLGPVFQQPRLDPDARLRAIAERSAAWLSPWTRACAVAAGGQLGAAAWRPALVASLDAPEPLVRETALWALAWAGLDEASAPRVEQLRADPAPTVAAMAAYVAETA